MSPQAAPRRPGTAAGAEIYKKSACSRHRTPTTSYGNHSKQPVFHDGCHGRLCLREVKR